MVIWMVISADLYSSPFSQHQTPLEFVPQTPAIGANQWAQCLPNGPAQLSAHAGRIRIAPKKDVQKKVVPSFWILWF